MPKTTTRRLFAVLVALLVICSVAGGPAVAAAAATGTFGDGVGSTLDADGGSTDDGSTDDGATDDDSTDDSADDGSSDDDVTEDDSSDESTDDGSSTDDSTADDSEDSTDDGSSTDDSNDDDSSDDSEDASVENVTESVDETTDDTARTVDGTTDAVSGAVGETTDAGFTLLGTVSETTDLQAALGLPTTGLHETERVDEPSDVRTAAGPSPPATDGGADRSAAPDAPLLVGSSAAASSLSGSDGDGGAPMPAGMTGGATLGIGALAAVAVARSTPLVAGSTTTGNGAGYLSSLLDKVKPVVFPLRYSRYDDSDPLEHDAREMVYEIVNETPGSYLSEVSERAGLPLSTTRHHMKVLEREELVSGAKLRGKRRFYPAYAEGIELAAALNDDSTASIIDALSRLGAASVSDLAEDLGRDPSTISHHLQRLEEDEIIVREREGRAVINKLSGEARTAMAPEATPRPGEAVEALAD